MFDDLRRAGHFAYESGDHGDAWIDLDRLLADPRRVDASCAQLAGKLVRFRPEVVCGPLLGGAFVAYAVARHLGAAFAYTAAPGYELPETLAPLVSGRRVVVVDDVVNAGAATDASARAVVAHGGAVVATAALAVRAPGNEGIEHLATMHWNRWPADECPLCRDGTPLDHRV